VHVPDEAEELCLSPGVHVQEVFLSYLCLYLSNRTSTPQIIHTA